MDTVREGVPTITAKVSKATVVQLKIFPFNCGGDTIRPISLSKIIGRNLTIGSVFELVKAPKLKRRIIKV